MAAAARRRPRRKAHTVVVIAASPVALFELAVPCEVFGIDRSELSDPWYRFIVASADGPGLVVETQVPGLTFNPTHGLEAVDEADTVIVPASHSAWPPAPQLLDALRRAAARGARMVSVC